MKKVLGLFLVAVLGGFTAIATLKALSDDAKPVVQVVENTPPIQYSSLVPNVPAALDFNAAAERTVNAVVHVRTQTELEPMYNPWMEFFGYEDEPQMQQGSGSGVIISPNGYIVTNNHVVAGATEIVISTNDNKTYTADVIGVDPSTDLALVKVDADDLPAIRFGNSDEVKIGDWVLAVGNPFDLTSTVTAGIVSAKARNINLLRSTSPPDLFPIESFIQTDAAVNPGNSGGALVDISGNLVGINTAIASRTGSYAGYSFAIPVSIVEKVTKDLMEFGDVQRAFIGVTINNVNEELADELGLDEIAGVYVNELMPEGAAAVAGIEPGDVIVGVGQSPVDNVPELQDQVSRYRPGDEVNISILRDGRQRNLMVTLKNIEGGTELGRLAAAEESTASILGAELATVEVREKQNLGIHGGAKIKGLKSGKLASAGVDEGFIITKIDGEKVYDPEDVTNILKSKSGGVLIEGVYPNGNKAYFGFGM